MRNTLRISNRIRTVLGRAPVLMVVCFIAYLLGAGSVSTANAREPNPSPASPATVDPWGIIIYNQPNYEGGGWISYKMEPGMRQKLVPQITPGWEDNVRSIQIGSQVAVILFAGGNFYAGSDSDYAGFGQPVAQVNVDFKVGSLIVYPKAAEGPLGVWLMDKRASGAICCGDTDNRREETFFPLPESESQLERAWPLLGQFNLDKNANEIAFDTRYVEVTLYEGRNFQGSFLTLPRAGYPPPQYVRWNFGGMGWSDRAASLKVRWIGPSASLGPKPPPPQRAFDDFYNTNLPGSDYKSFFLTGGPDDCKDACAADPKCKAYTWVTAGVQGPKAACWLKSTVPYVAKDPNCVSGYVRGLKPQEPPFPSGQGTVTFTPDISGKWLNSTGTLYKIAQSGAKFTWNVKQFNEQGSGTLTGVQISASWSGEKGTGSTTGKVIVDASGQAIRIEWNNAAVFFKQ